MKSERHTWDGRAAKPDTGGRLVLVRIRCRSWGDVYRQQEPKAVADWPRWSHDGGPGDIVEFEII
jgi:hypothetical protein